MWFDVKTGSAPPALNNGSSPCKQKWFSFYFSFSLHWRLTLLMFALIKMAKLTDIIRSFVSWHFGNDAKPVLKTQNLQLQAKYSTAQSWLAHFWRMGSYTLLKVIYSCAFILRRACIFHTQMQHCRERSEGRPMESYFHIQYQSKVWTHLLIPGFFFIFTIFYIVE